MCVSGQSGENISNDFAEEPIHMVQATYESFVDN